LALVERRGDVGGIQVRNIIAPDAGVAVLVFTNNAEFDFGEIWQGQGFSHDLLAAALCGAAR
jgi:D-alanyl-D-alanine carboxypeptidase